MPVLKVFKGRDSYKDVECYENVVNYPFDKKYYTGNCMYRKILDPEDREFLKEQFMAVGNLNQRKSVLLNHFVLGLKDISLTAEQTRNLMEITVGYFAKRKFQVICAEHYGSDSDPFYHHIHVIINHVAIDGSLFYGSDQDYYEFLAYLRNGTHYKWSFTPASVTDYVAGVSAW